MAETDIYIQWQGTAVCGDFHCECGQYAHLCGAKGMFSIKCARCGVVWELVLRRTENVDGDVVAKDEDS
jgi:hypothetical protein